ncbi:low temperature requirement protein A [Microbispora sp. NEAU-D428]|uniref:low temperature requirement protein A n=1 Tax=Microbispora sitophila TaxID=2771537 RepID=UPI00186925EF|nr:low temperature requirement protein A [Microbispora sitophila]MBE3012610.1 low temperature requirement protein A [Microbispora sitophila]
MHTGTLRPRGGEQRVTFTELFFDLVYVFAVTQLSHLLLGHLSWHGAAQTLLLLLAVWWAWIYTAWHTNWFDPDRPSVRIVLVAVMLASLVMSAALPRAFGEHGLMFAAAYVAVQVVRTASSVAAAPRGPLRRNLARVLAWAVLSGAFWIAGGLAHGLPRELLWAAAVGTDLLAPWVGFVTPGLGRSATTDWSIDGAHLAERCQLFLIIAFGESILVTGATFAAHPSRAAGTALLTAFGASVGLWWTYFGSSAEAGSRVIAAADDPGRLARSAYTFLHLPMVAGVVVSAVADELVIHHPGGHTAPGTAIAVLGGPALFLTGHALFKRAVWGRVPRSHLAGVLVLAALGALTPLVPPLALAACATATVAGVAVRTALARRREPQEG